MCGQAGGALDAGSSQKRFTVLGDWAAVEKAEAELVQELLAVQGTV